MENQSIGYKEHYEENESSCDKPLNKNVFISGMYELVRPCRHLRKLLHLDRIIIQLPILTTILLGYFAGNNHIAIPLEMLAHFTPNRRITKENNMEILMYHLRFVHPRLRYLYQSFHTEPNFIQIHDFQPLETIDMPSIELEPEENFFCKVCSRNIPEQYKMCHSNAGPFAIGHVLHSLPCAEIDILMAINNYHFVNNQASCKICPTQYTLLYHSTELSTHAKVHGGAHLRPECTPQDGKALLWNWIKKQDSLNIHVCYGCHRFFPNMRLLYLHATLTEHKEGKNFCISCKGTYVGKLVEHIEENHADEAVCPFMCIIKGSLLAHHIMYQHKQQIQQIPVIEAEKVRNKALGYQDRDKIIGKYDHFLFNKHFDYCASALATSPSYKLADKVKYHFIDPEGWKLAKKILNARNTRTKLRPMITAQVKHNLLRYTTKIIMINQHNMGYLRREESPYLIFQQSPMEKSIHSFLYETMTFYSSEFLDSYKMIIFGNHFFKMLPTTPGFECLNLSTVTSTLWSFDYQGHILVFNESNFNKHIEIELGRMDLTKKIIVLEGTLYPFLAQIPENEQVIF